MLHKNQNFQKILRAVELAFDTGMGNDEFTFDPNQNENFKRLDVSNLEVMPSDIHCSENTDENNANEINSKDTKKPTPMTMKSSISDSDDNESGVTVKKRRKRRTRKAILVIKSEVLADTSSESTDIED